MNQTNRADSIQIKNEQSKRLIEVVVEDFFTDEMFADERTEPEFKI